MQELSATNAPGTAGATSQVNNGNISTSANASATGTTTKQKAPPNPASEAAKAKGNQAMGRHAHAEAHKYYTEALVKKNTIQRAFACVGMCLFFLHFWGLCEGEC